MAERQSLWLRRLIAVPGVKRSAIAALRFRASLRHFPSLQWRRVRRLRPFSRTFGIDRGPTSVTRYYVDGFIARHADDIRGRVLEMGDPRYTRNVGGDRVEHSDVLHLLPGNEHATIVGDLCCDACLEKESYDCVILTQTLQFIYDFRAALRNAVASLKPGGVLLVTVSGITQISRHDLERWGDYWRFTPLSVDRVFAEVLPREAYRIEAYGNVLAAIGLLHGLCSCELSRRELDFWDEDYPVVIGVRAVRPHRMGAHE